MHAIKTRVGLSLLIAAVASMVGTLRGQEPGNPVPPSTASTPQSTPLSQAPVLTEADRIVALQRLIEIDEARLVELERDSESVSEEFDRLSADMGRRDEVLARLRSQIDDANRQGLDTEVAELQDEIARLQAERDEVRTEFDQTIARRRAIDRQMAILPAKVNLERQGLARLTQPNAAESNVYEPIDSQPVESTPMSSVGGGDYGPAGVLAAAEQGEAELVYDPIVADATKEVVAAEQRLRDGEARVQLLDRGLDLFRADLDITRELLSSERQEAELAQATIGRLNERLAALVADDSAAAEMARLREELGQAQARLETAQRDAGRYSDRLELITVQVGQLEETFDESVQALDELRGSAREAGERLDFAQSPFAPHRLSRWMMREGIVILVVLGLMAALWMLSQVVARRVVMALARRSHRGSDLEREERAQTIKRVFQSVTGIFITTIGGLAVLDQVGIDVTVLLGGAAVFGMAVAFGAQALVKDYFSGFIMLMENQYRVGNVVRIGDVAGTVEDVTLRMTVLRDLKGVAHFIPHGQIAAVSNLTHGWSRVVFDIGVGYGEDVDRVMHVLTDLAKELREDPQFGPFILGEAEMLGVDSFDDSAVTVKFLVKTRPLQQWVVKRELLRRIKHAFDAEGIEIPFPHRTIYHRKFEDRLAVSIDESAAQPNADAG